MEVLQVDFLVFLISEYRLRRTSAYFGASLRIVLSVARIELNDSFVYCIIVGANSVYRTGHIKTFTSRRTLTSSDSEKIDHKT